MIMDNELIFIYNKDFYLSSHSSNVDTLEFGGDVLGKGNKLEWFITVNTDYADGGTIQFKLQGSADGSSYSDIILTPEYSASDLSSGVLLQFPIPNAEGYKYFKIVAVIDDSGGTTPFTAGKITSGINLG